MSCVVSIIICTRNRADSLRETLASIGRCDVPADLPAELLVVDNGSTDPTREVVEQANLANLPVRYIHEPRKGKGYAYNTGMAEANGSIFLFTDDDVRVPTDWIQGMCRPIVAGEAGAAVGTIRMAVHLRRPWMRAEHFLWLACNEGLDEDAGSPELIGASMVVVRRWMERVGGFDVELGPGRGTGGDDTLLSWQLRDQGCQIVRLREPVVEHHFDPDRLTRDSFLMSARKSGWNDAYLRHHWLHQTPSHPYARAARAWLRLWWYRLRRWHEWQCDEGIPAWEKGMIQEVHTLLALASLTRVPRRYSVQLRKARAGCPA